MELRFIERYDENGKFYAEYISANLLGTTESSRVYHSFLPNRLFEAEIPSLSGLDRARLPLREDELENWCVDGGGGEIISANFAEGYEEILGGADPARLIYNVTDNYRAVIAQKSFSSLSEADYEYLLYTALFRTPTVDCGAEEGHALTELLRVFQYQYGPYAVYGSDVEKTFRYLFGDEIEYVPKNLREFGWRYVPEADVYISASDGLMTPAGRPCVVDVRQEGEIYEIDAFLGLASIGDELLHFYSGSEEVSYSADDLSALYETQVLYTYSLEKAGDGRFVLRSVRAARGLGAK